MNKQSLTISSLFALVLVYIFQGTGIEIASEEIQVTVETILKVVSMIGIYWGRYKQGDINIFGSSN